MIRIIQWYIHNKLGRFYVNLLFVLSVILLVAATCSEDETRNGTHFPCDRNYYHTEEEYRKCEEANGD